MSDIVYDIPENVCCTPRANSHVDTVNFPLLYKALVRPHVEYANQIWEPYLKHMRVIENEQRRATKLVPDLKEKYHMKKDNKTISGSKHNKRWNCKVIVTSTVVTFR